MSITRRSELLRNTYTYLLVLTSIVLTKDKRFLGKLRFQDVFAKVLNLLFFL